MIHHHRYVENQCNQAYQFMDAGIVAKILLVLCVQNVSMLQNTKITIIGYLQQKVMDFVTVVILKLFFSTIFAASTKRQPKMRSVPGKSLKLSLVIYGPEPKSCFELFCNT